MADNYSGSDRKGPTLLVAFHSTNMLSPKNNSKGHDNMKSGQFKVMYFA